jgi:3-dehydrosphinganine reductase
MNEDPMFKDAVVVITGGSSGLGNALARRLIKKGATLALIARNKDKLVSVKEELSALCENDQKVEIFPCDVSDHAAVEQAMKAIADSVGLPDILINNAGILREGYFEKLSLITFREIMDINYFGVLNCTKAMMPLFKQKGGGRIVNVSSLGGKMASFGYSAYCSSKFAVVGLTETLRMELKPGGIKMHLVCPGEFESPMAADLNTYRTAENRVVTQTVPVLSLDFVADEIIRGIQRDRYLIIPGRTARFLERLGRFFPSLMHVITDIRIRGVHAGPR